MAESKYDKIPGGVSGEFILTPSLSRKESLHVFQVINHLKARERRYGVKLHIDAQLIKTGVLISWKEL